MKKILLSSLLALSAIASAQVKSTGIKNIGSMTIKIDLDQATSVATFTMTGPSNKWFTVGLHATTMSTNTPIDCLTYSTSLLDQHLSGGHNAAITDATQNYTLVSNTVSGTTRTVVATRPFSTGDANDYTLTYSMTSMSIIWAVGPSTNVNSEHATKGSSSVTFTTLGLDPLSLDNKLSVYPNPCSDKISIKNDFHTRVQHVAIYNTEAQLVRNFDVGLEDADIPVSLSGIASGVYFVEIAADNDRTVKKIVIE